jgi:predicted DNA-binding ribbon-helix-helix protein
VSDATASSLSGAVPSRWPRPGALDPRVREDDVEVIRRNWYDGTGREVAKSAGPIAMPCVIVELTRLGLAADCGSVKMPRRTSAKGEDMCHLFASQSPESYASETRSIRLNGQSTSIRLEKLFWQILDQIAASEGVTAPRLISTLHSEILLTRGEVSNFTSSLRCMCMLAIEQKLARLEPRRAEAA